MDTLQAIVELTHATPVFDREADRLIARVREMMNVPERADPDVEEELAALRGDFGAFLPEFRQLFSGLLIEHLGGAAPPEVLEALSTEPAQRYLQAADRLELGLHDLLVRLGAAMSFVVRQTAPTCAGR